MWFTYRTGLAVQKSGTTSKLEGRALAESEREELIRLRKENRTLLMEKEILKKASAFFAKEMK
jgi:transposase